MKKLERVFVVQINHRFLFNKQEEKLIISTVQLFDGNNCMGTKPKIQSYYAQCGIQKHIYILR